MAEELDALLQLHGVLVPVTIVLGAFQLSKVKLGHALFSPSLIGDYLAKVQLRLLVNLDFEVLSSLEFYLLSGPHLLLLCLARRLAGRLVFCRE